MGDTGSLVPRSPQCTAQCHHHLHHRHDASSCPFVYPSLLFHSLLLYVPGGWFLRLPLPDFLPAGFLIGLVNWRWRTEHRVFLPHVLLVCLIYSHGCLLSTRSFCQVASAPKIPALSGLQHLISSPCPFKTWVVSLPLFPVSGCPNTRVYFPVTTGTMIHSVAGTIPVRFCVLPGSWWSTVIFSVTIDGLRFVYQTLCFPWGKYYFTNEKVDLAILEILSQVTQLVSCRVRIQATPEPLFTFPRVLQYCLCQNTCLLQIKVLRNRPTAPSRNPL